MITNLITDMLTGIIGLLMDTVRVTGAAFADHLGALHVKYNNPEMF